MRQQMMRQQMMKRSVLCLLLVISIVGVRCKQDEAPAKALPRAEPFNSMTHHGFSGSSTSVVVSVGNTTSDFKVNFAGLIVVANYDDAGTETSPRRAMLVEGKQDMEHEPLLIVGKPSDATELANLEADLKDGTGHTADCSGSRYPDHCIVDLTGVAVQVHDSNGGKAPGQLGYDNTQSFARLVPSIKKKAKPKQPNGPDTDTDLMTGLRQQMLPASPVAAYFEIDGGGTLGACPFSQGGHFSDEPSNASNQFASDVFWVGQTDPRYPAVLQLAYKVTNNQLVWKTIRTANKGVLKIGISNEPKPPVQFSTQHFQLFDKVLNGGSVLKITAGGPPQCPQGCLKCASFLAVIPGCSDSQWP